MCRNALTHDSHPLAVRVSITELRELQNPESRIDARGELTAPRHIAARLRAILARSLAHFADTCALSDKSRGIAEDAEPGPRRRDCNQQRTTTFLSEINCS